MTERRRWILADHAGERRCWWCGEDPLYRDYHDNEWGRPIHDDARLLEKLCLEGFQCGLSWITILRKRERFRTVFQDFDAQRVARFTSRRVDKLVLDAGIIRHRGKIESTINNAQRALEITDEIGSLTDYLWSFAPNDKAAPRSGRDIPVKTRDSEKLSKDLKRRGFSFVGPTTVYAFMQAVGMVNDHLAGCHFRSGVESVRNCSTKRG